MRVVPFRIAASPVSLRFFVVTALLSLVTACASAPPIGDGPFASEKGPFVIDVPASLRALGGDETFEMVFQDPDGELFVGIVVDEKPLALEDLDTLVEKNLKSAGYDGARVLAVEKTSLGGLPAHRSIIHVLSGERSFLMLNTHTSTERESVQLIVWGVSSIGHMVRGTADSLAHSRFRFLDGTRAFVSAERHQLENVERPFTFTTPPVGWTPMRKGALRREAAVELEHRSGGYFAFALTRAHAGASFVDEASRLEQDLLAMFDDSVEKPTTAGRAGSEPDVSWSQSGVLAKEKVHVTYRVRLIRVGDTDVQIFCWGETAAGGLDDACGNVMAAVEPRHGRGGR